MLELRTSRLRLRDLRTDDWPTVLLLARERGVTRFQTSLPSPTATDARRWVARAIHHNGRRPRRAYNLAIEADGRVIGWIGWGGTADEERVEYEVGYALLPSAWGRGYMTEALRSAVAYMFDALAADRVVGVCSSANVGSARVLRKAGLRVVDPDAGDDRDPDALRYAVEAADRHLPHPV